MLPSARLLLRLLALLLILQPAGLPWPHAGAALAGEAIVICSPDGTRTVLLGPDGQPLPPEDAALACCLLCQGPLAGVALLPAPALPTPAMVAAPDPAMAEAVRRLCFRPPPATHRSRAPPLS
jgi:hypothetical protein